MKPIPLEVEVFAEVFVTGGASLHETCACGKVFYDTHNSYDWEEGEYEALENDPAAIPKDYAIRRIELEAKYYVEDCDCWHPRAKKVTEWLEYHAERIGMYFRVLKDARIREADKLPVDINEPYPAGFRSMVGAPKNATWVEVLLENGNIIEAHWAQDLSGEYQPPFKGWFNRSLSQIEDPIAWKPIEKEAKIERKRGR